MQAASTKWFGEHQSRWKPCHGKLMKWWTITLKSRVQTWSSIRTRMRFGKIFRTSKINWARKNFTAAPFRATPASLQNPVRKVLDVSSYLPKFTVIPRYRSIRDLVSRSWNFGHNRLADRFCWDIGKRTLVEDDELVFLSVDMVDKLSDALFQSQIDESIWLDLDFDDSSLRCGCDIFFTLWEEIQLDETIRETS